MDHIPSWAKIRCCSPFPLLIFIHFCYISDSLSWLWCLMIASSFAVDLHMKYTVEVVPLCTYILWFVIMCKKSWLSPLHSCWWFRMSLDYELTLLPKLISLGLAVGKTSYGMCRTFLASNPNYPSNHSISPLPHSPPYHHSIPSPLQPHRYHDSMSPPTIPTLSSIYTLP